MLADAFSPDRTDQPLIRGGAAVGDLLAEPNHRAVGVIERHFFQRRESCVSAGKIVIVQAANTGLT